MKETYKKNQEKIKKLQALLNSIIKYTGIKKVNDVVTTKNDLRIHYIDYAIRDIILKINSLRKQENTKQLNAIDRYFECLSNNISRALSHILKKYVTCSVTRTTIRCKDIVVDRTPGWTNLVKKNVILHNKQVLIWAHKIGVTERGFDLYRAKYVTPYGRGYRTRLELNDGYACVFNNTITISKTEKGAKSTLLRLLKQQVLNEL